MRFALRSTARVRGRSEAPCETHGAFGFPVNSPPPSLPHHEGGGGELPSPPGGRGWGEGGSRSFPLRRGGTWSEGRSAAPCEGPWSVRLHDISPPPSLPLHGGGGSETPSPAWGRGCAMRFALRSMARVRGALAGRGPTHLTHLSQPPHTMLTKTPHGASMKPTQGGD